MTTSETIAFGRTPRRWLIPAGLALLWIGICWWQWLEHARVRESVTAARVQRGRDVAVILETVIRATRRFHTISRSRLQNALTELANTRDLVTVALVSPSGQAVAQAGEPLPAQALAWPAGSERWTDDTLTLVEYVRLGGGPDTDEKDAPEVMVVEGFRRPKPTNENKNGPEDGTPNEAGADTREARPEKENRPPVPSAEDIKRIMERFRNRDREDWRTRRYPPWMTEEKYREMLEKQGLRKFIIVLGTKTMADTIATDRFQRLMLCLAALMVALSMLAGWLVSEKALALRLDLLRAGDMNAHLREMNASAAGLAHETRNPLNVVRGLARLIRDHPGTDREAGEHADAIMEEVDRINSRLDQFIAYSKPYSPTPARVRLRALVQDVFGTLEYDREDHELTFRNEVPDVTVAADEGLLRQVLFNLLLNACQAVERGGTIDVAVRRNGDTLSLHVCDDGPGIPERRWDDIFRPYVSLRDTGTGLGLAIVKQIAWAHRWHVSCRHATLGGAELVVSGLIDTTDTPPDTQQPNGQTRT